MKKIAVGWIMALLCSISYAEELPIDAKWNEIELQNHTFQAQNTGFKQAVYQLKLEKGASLEFSLRMEINDTIVYSWTSNADSPDSILTEFHGHNEPAEGERGMLIFYKKHNSNSGAGSMSAPFAGNHGWYLKNTSDRNLTVTLTVAGWYSGVKNS